jgi:hypothetical protein
MNFSSPPETKEAAWSFCLVAPMDVFEAELGQHFFVCGFVFLQRYQFV